MRAYAYALLLGFLVVLAFAVIAKADDGWTYIGPPPPVPPLEEPLAPASQPSASNVGQEPAQAKDGAPGPQGPAGPQGEPGQQGPAGVNADLCQNIPGVQTTPPAKVWPQRYWTFRPRLERRHLAVNGKGQIVCVTRRWIKAHHALTATDFKRRAA